MLKGEGTTIRRSYQAYVHILNVRQSAYARKIELVNNNTLGLPKAATDGEDEEFIVLRPGSRAKVRFEFAKRPVSKSSMRRCTHFAMGFNVLTKSSLFSLVSGVHSTRYAYAVS